MAKDVATPRMQCMEVWGGNSSVERSLELTGLDMWVYSRPHGGALAGGDIHYVSACGSGRITRILVADVSGHGEQVAEVAGFLRSVIHRYVNFIDQTSLVQRINARFCDHLGDGQFATALVATFFAPTRLLTLSNAGHPPPLLYRERERVWEYLRAEPESGHRRLGNIPLGIAADIPYSSRSVRLEPGDLVLSYTDSLIEMGSGLSGMAGMDGLLALVQRTPMDSLQDFIPGLLKAAEAEHHVTLGDDDDVTLVLMRCTGGASYAPFVQQVVGLGRFLRALVSREAKAEPIPWPEWSVANMLGGMIPFFNRFWRPKPD
ncbi:MAG: serine/threonine-protein phosphatase [Candidatus Hydrogenedentes bacterium]|nr:serine/threonine-protein phosphatase [Candidatus Hydrogenedentota bacterium]